MEPDAEAALFRLIDIARSDTGQSRRVADFLLAWWNAGSCGSFDLTSLWALDWAIVEDMTKVFRRLLAFIPTQINSVTASDLKRSLEPGVLSLSRPPRLRFPATRVSTRI